MHRAEDEASRSSGSGSSSRSRAPVLPVAFCGEGDNERDCVMPSASGFALGEFGEESRGRPGKPAYFFRLGIARSDPTALRYLRIAPCQRTFSRRNSGGPDGEGKGSPHWCPYPSAHLLSRPTAVKLTRCQALFRYPLRFQIFAGFSGCVLADESQARTASSQGPGPTSRAASQRHQLPASPPSRSSAVTNVSPRSS
jgi:hypothetical protein